MKKRLKQFFFGHNQVRRDLWSTPGIRGIESEKTSFSQVVCFGGNCSSIDIVYNLVRKPEFK